MLEEAFEVAVIMAGGRGSRLWGPSKPFINVCGRPLLEHALLPALQVSRRALVAVSGDTLRYASSLRLPARASYLMTDGHGYEHDVNHVLRMVRARPLLLLPGDVVGLTPEMLSYLYRVSDEADEQVLTVKDGGTYIGVSVFKGHSTEPWRDVEVNWGVINVNTPAELGEALARC